MPLGTLIVALLVIGMLVWAIGFLPMIDATIKQLLRGLGIFIAVILLVIWLLGVFGFSTPINL